MQPQIPVTQGRELERPGASPTAAYHDGVVGPGDEGDEERQHHVDEEGDEGVQVHLAEDPHQRAAVLHLREGDEHVIAVDQGEQTLGHHGERAELHTHTHTHAHTHTRTITDLHFTG